MTAPRVLLLPGQAAYDGPSMTRYARELSSALVTLPGRSPGIMIEQPVGGPRFFGRRLESAWFCYVTYSRSMRHRRAAAFHILDHGYAHLIRSLDPERTIITCHDLIPLLAADGVIQMPLPAIVARTVRWRIAHLARARAVIAASETTRMTIERYTRVRPERIRVVPHGVSPRFRPVPGRAAATRTSTGLAGADAVLLQVASAARYKNTPVLLHALAQLRTTRGEGVRLVRIGASLFPDERRLAARLGVLGSIRELGTVDESTLVDWYNAADVLVFPSLWEGFGWPPLEAMACGTPVVASDTPAVVEVVGNAGLLTTPTDPSALAAAIERVLTEPVLNATLRQAGPERAKQFTWAATASRTLAVYDEVLRG